MSNNDNIVEVSIYVKFKEIPVEEQEEFLQKVKDKLSSTIIELSEARPVFKFVVY